MDMRDSGQKDLEPNMQTNRKTTANEATRMSGRISEIRDINVIKRIPWRHQLLYLLDVISWLLEAVQFLIVPATRCTWVRESDPRREQLPMRRKRRRKTNTTSIQSSSRYFQSQHPLSVNTGGLRPITSAERHQQKGERRERVPVRAGSQWEGLFKSGSEDADASRWEASQTCWIHCNVHQEASLCFWDYHYFRKRVSSVTWQIQM